MPVSRAQMTAIVSCCRMTPLADAMATPGTPQTCARTSSPRNVAALKAIVTAVATRARPHCMRTWKPMPNTALTAAPTARAKRKVVLAGHEVFWGLGRRPRMLRSRGGLFLIFRRVAAILV